MGKLVVVVAVVEVQMGSNNLDTLEDRLYNIVLDRVLVVVVPILQVLVDLVPLVALLVRVVQLVHFLLVVLELLLFQVVLVDPVEVLVVEVGNRWVDISVHRQRNIPMRNQHSSLTEIVL